MVDWLSSVVAVVSVAIAVYAAYWARRSARGTFAHTAYELVRALHTDLTTGATAQARDVLEHFRSGTRYHGPGRDGLPQAAGTQEVLEAYFALLWCFERILIGRRSLTKQQAWNDTGPAVKFLDDLLTWHLQRWSERWQSVRAALKAPDRVPDLRDHDSLGSFCDLVEEVAGPNEHTALLRALIHQESEQGVGVT
ncbi:hypothetical protein BX264_4607 [Streptomyces sp. 2333.5]|uniref:hypothetical protein n=1 Tax=unclassified Streptomyces TaxID=2593676 RepID=UPI000898C451|nr:MULTISPECIES: hypothetical protein [unclassified Streptomyces]PJJ04203.1 hypothetical protein BX264_4607 [Streptomyces sp. 2333.5]SEE70972.1 hypothetical protein SAMN05428942_4708 [Streptomyces sp. 2112.2]